MKNLPDKKALDIMWTVATSSSLESGTRPHYGFADLLYDYLIDRQPPVGLYEPQREKSTPQTT